MSELKTITSLYQNYKNSPKKLKIVCDWDEVIQPCEPYACWMMQKNKPRLMHSRMQPMDFQKVDSENFSDYFKYFWEWSFLTVEYSHYGSSLKYSDGVDQHVEKEVKENKFEDQQIWKNSPNFYQEAPFLTIAEDLLRLIKEDKVEELIFLTTGDKRKLDMFAQSFGSLGGLDDGSSEKDWVRCCHGDYRVDLSIKFMSDIENQGKTKAEWVKENASDFDLVIDDNPFICKSLLPPKNCKYCLEIAETHDGCMGCSDCWDTRCSKCEKMDKTVLAPYYPAVENQHDKEVLLVKQEVSDLKKEDFDK